MMASESAPVGPAGGAIDPYLQREIEATRGHGQRLPAAIAQRAQPQHRNVIDDVRVHTDAHAAQLSRSLNAEAFTLGRDVYFGDGAYQPGSSGGDQLLAHELTHVAQQQNTTGAAPGKLQVGPSNNAFENQAERAAIGHDGSPQTHSAVQIQRKMNFGYENLPDDLKQGKTAKSFGKQGVFSDLVQALQDYDNINGIKKEMVQLQVLKRLAIKWYKEHPKISGFADLQKDSFLTRMLEPLRNEIVLKEQEYAAHQATTKTQYLADVKTESKARAVGETAEQRQGNRFNAMSEPTKLYKRARALEKGRVATDTDGNEVEGQNSGAIQMMHQYGLTSADVLGIQTYVSENFNYINPALGRDKAYLEGRWDNIPQDSKEALKPLIKQTLGRENLKGVSAAESSAVASDSLIEQGRAHAKVAKWAMRKLPDCPPQTVYRGESLSEVDFAHLKKTKHKQVPNFWSLSKNRDASESFAVQNAWKAERPIGILYVIHYQHSGKDIAGLSQKAGEAEVLLMPKVPFRVAKMADKSTEKAQMWEVHLEHASNADGSAVDKKEKKEKKEKK